MPRPRMTLQGWIITVALAALVLGVATEWLRSTNVRQGTGYERARAVVAARQSRRPVSSRGADDLSPVLGVVAAALIAARLRRRFLKPV